MSNTVRTIAIAALVVAVGVVIVAKRQATQKANPVADGACCPVGVPPGLLGAAATTSGQPVPMPSAGLPRLVDLGAGKCIPCKMMAPILEELKKEYAGKLQVDFIDVWVNPDAGKPYKITLIPTQIFYDAAGKELWRHEGFIAKEDILAKWKELGVDLTAAPGQGGPQAFERLQPGKPDDRPKDRICHMCDGDIDPKTLVVVQTDKGDVRLCGPHCYFILYSCLTEDKTGFEKKVSVTDWSTGKPVRATEAIYLCGLDEKTGRSTIGAFADQAAASKERAASGGNVSPWAILQRKELATRCGFCDRAVYPEDAATVRVDGLYTWGCCSHCALGVAARTGKDIEVHERDRLTGEEIVVKTLNGNVASIEPRTAVAWFGQRQLPDGRWASAGCFHQGFFATAENLKKWVEAHPYETGRLIGINQALADKMKLTPQQIQKACKIGECAPTR
jgi:thioredoxin 1